MLFTYSPICRVSSKNSKKRARKTGRKGTVEEEEYILLSIGKMPGRLEAIQGELKMMSFAGDVTLTASNQPGLRSCCRTCSNTQTNIGKKAKSFKEI